MKKSILAIAVLLLSLTACSGSTVGNDLIAPAKWGMTYNEFMANEPTTFMGYTIREMIASKGENSIVHTVQYLIQETIPEGSTETEGSPEYQRKRNEATYAAYDDIYEKLKKIYGEPYNQEKTDSYQNARWYYKTLCIVLTCSQEGNNITDPPLEYQAIRVQIHNDALYTQK